MQVMGATHPQVMVGTMMMTVFKKSYKLDKPILTDSPTNINYI